MTIDDIMYQIRGAVFEVNKVLGYGLLVNFTREKAEIKRLVLELPAGQRK